MGKNNHGVTLVEILIVMAIMLLLLAIYFALRGQLNKARDAKRKDDLEKIRVVFEDYFNDHNCYPDISVLQNCGSDALKPYLNKIPCEPVTNQPYKAIAGAAVETSCYSWYKVYTLLENGSDFAISKLGLSGGKTIDGASVNYGVCSPNVAVGDVPLTSFVCPSTGEPAPRVTTCFDPYDMVGDCGRCGCLEEEKVTQGPRGYYCCPDEICQ